MNHRERALAALRFQTYDRLPIVHFTFWKETIQKWTAEGHISAEEARRWEHWGPGDAVIARKLGFDFGWGNCFMPYTGLFPPIEERVLRELPDGSRYVLTDYGATVLQRDGAVSIPAEVDRILKGRTEWDEFFSPRLQFSLSRLASAEVNVGNEKLPYKDGGLGFLRSGKAEWPVGLFCGSLYGVIRNWLGLENSAYLQVDEPKLFDEIIDTVGNLCFECTRAALEDGGRFDYAHFWEDICFRAGPLVSPRVFREKVAPHYRRITDMLTGYGIDIVSVDCDGRIDALVPIWLDAGVNTMFPIEVGVWNASLEQWRVAYGRRVLGVGGVDKRVFARDYTAVDAEVERLRSLVDLGGYIPCPDHLLAPDAKWENVQYYCERMRATFG